VRQLGGTTPDAHAVNQPQILNQNDRPDKRFTVAPFHRKGRSEACRVLILMSVLVRISSDVQPCHVHF
jgi:hypothetical protein